MSRAIFIMLTTEQKNYYCYLLSMQLCILRSSSLLSFATFSIFSYFSLSLFVCLPPVCHLFSCFKKHRILLLIIFQEHTEFIHFIFFFQSFFFASPTNFSVHFKRQTALSAEKNEKKNFTRKMCAEKQKLCI